MLRYYLIATALVLGALLVGSLFVHRGPALDVASVESSGAPSLGRGQPASSYEQRAVRGPAPWALSALPECFHQVSEAHGSNAYVRSRLPRGARAIVDDVEVDSGDCVVSIYADAAEVDRGDNRLFIPPDAHFFVTPANELILVRRDGEHAEVRVYRAAEGVKMAFRRTLGTPGPQMCLRHGTRC